jgi:nitrogen fixation/metabolism regulation signal transduction histidine kinase
MRWAVGVSVAVAAALALILLFLLTSVTRNAAQFDRFYTPLLWLNIAVAAGLLLVGLGLGARLVRRLAQRRFGSRLLARLALIFVVVGAAPGLLIYLVSYQFVSRSIESWFDVKVENALDAGLNLGRSSLDALLEDLQAKTKAAALQLAESGLGPLAMDRARDRTGADQLVVFNQAGQVLATAGTTQITLLPDIPSGAQLRQLRFVRGIAQIEPVGEDAQAGLRMRVVVPLPQGSSLAGDIRYLQVLQPVPDSVARNALAVQEAYREYQERALGRKGLQRLYIGTLTLALCLALFGAVVMAVVLGNQLARPLLVLAEGVKAVAEGDLSPKQEMATQDELGGLTRDFNSMTRQLAEARALAEARRAEVETSRAYLQSLLDNMSAGVLVLDGSETVRLFNPSAERILHAALQVGEPLQTLPGGDTLAPMVRNGFASLDAERDHWVQQVELKIGESTVTLLVRGALLALPGRSALPELQEQVVVFDDISELISAQRSVAWAEVARRVAHEIKNPLTPIQLSAERLQHKLAEQLTPESRAVLEKGVSTIVNQVDAMKRMVNDFRDYARLPRADLKALNLNELVEEVLHLYGSPEWQRMLQVQLQPGLPLIEGDAAQLRQVLHNLLQNARDAVSEAPREQPPSITVRTEKVAGSDGAARVRLVVSDNGPGFAEAILKRAFEPYVTTKSKGTGLGLAIVRKIVDEHGGKIDCRNLEQGGHIRGAQVSLTFRAGMAERKAA